MEDAWAVAEEMVEAQRAEAGIFQKWEADGEAHVMVLCGEPYARKMHWTGTLYEDCKGKGCDACAGGSRTTLRVSLNAFHVGEQRMKIIEGGTRWFGDVQKVRKKYGLDTWAFEITRNGAPRDPKTTYSILPDHQLDEATERKISAAKRHDLAREATVAAREAFAGQAGEDASVKASKDSAMADDQKVPHAVAKELHGLLKECTKGQVQEFLEVFDVRGVSHLRSADEERARRYIAAFNEAPPF